MPGDRGDPSALAWLIGSELKRERLRAKVSGTVAGKVIGVSHATISYMESGSTQQEPAKVTKLLKSYGCDQADVDRLARLAGRYATEGTWWADFRDVVADWLATFLGLEALASAEFVWEPSVLPGMLQIPEYHEALLHNHLRLAPAEVPQVVSLRRARQERLLGTNPLTFTTVIEERILDRPVGDPQVMRRQLEKLLEWNSLPNVNLHVMAEESGVHDGLDGEFTLLDFAEARSVGYIEFPDGGVYIQDQDRVREYNLARERMCAAATASVEEAITSRLDRLAGA